MKKIFLVLIGLAIVIIVFLAMIFYFRFDKWLEHQSENAALERDYKTILIENNTDSMMYVIFCCQDMQTGKEVIAVDSGGGCKDTIPLSGKGNTAYSRYYKDLPVYRNDTVPLPASTRLVILNSNKHVIKEYSAYDLQSIYGDSLNKIKDISIILNGINDTIRIQSAKKGEDVP
ncbi:hypothetical protein ACTHGU_21485 [Chitinophagaceae bacterium MMS25-I14]